MQSGRRRQTRRTNSPQSHLHGPTSLCFPWPFCCGIPRESRDIACASSLKQRLESPKQAHKPHKAKTPENVPCVLHSPTASFAGLFSLMLPQRRTKCKNSRNARLRLFLHLPAALCRKAVRASVCFTVPLRTRGCRTAPSLPPRGRRPGPDFS